MASTRPTLTRALVVGSLWHFVAGVAVPVVVAGAAGVLSSHSFTSDLTVMLIVITSAILGALFVLHEVVVLIALAVLRRRPADPPPETDLGVDLLTTVIGTDLLAVSAGAALMAWRKVEGMGGLAPFLALFLPAYHGVSLLTGRIRDALAPADAPAEVPGLRRRIGLQIYVATAVAVLGFAAVGWPHEPMATFAIGIVSILSGRIAVAVARHRDRRSRA